MPHLTGCPQRPPKGLSRRVGWFSLKGCLCSQIKEGKILIEKVEKPPVVYCKTPKKMDILLQKLKDTIHSDRMEFIRLLKIAVNRLDSANKLKTGYFQSLRLSPGDQLEMIEYHITRDITNSNGLTEIKTIFQTTITEVRKEVRRCLLLSHRGDFARYRRMAENLSIPWRLIIPGEDGSRSMQKIQEPHLIIKCIASSGHTITESAQHLKFNAPVEVLPKASISSIQRMLLKHSSPIPATV